MFRSATRRSETRQSHAGPMPATHPQLLVHAGERVAADPSVLDSLRGALPEGAHADWLRPAPVAVGDAGTAPIQADFVLSLFVDPQELDGVSDRVNLTRRSGRSTTLVVAVRPTQLAALGRWLNRRANAGQLHGLRLLMATSLDEVVQRLPERLEPASEENVIRMPVSAEVENSPVRHFYVFSPQIQALIKRIRGFAQNGINRAYLLGGPGSGKTTLSYYYFLLRNRGRYVSVNLAAENTGDKAAVKSLLCGHVSGAFPGAGARTGAFTHARDGVCFIDESHDVSGAVMEVLMEALDSNQFLPYGASAKQQLQCAILFASNRSWTHLQNTVNLDEFTRLGAATLQVPPLAEREEEMMAVAATLLAKMGDKCTTWVAPIGLADDAWQRVRECPWHGNVRSLVRVLEAAFVDAATRGGQPVLTVGDIEHGIALWEPKSHHSHKIYAAA